MANPRNTWPVQCAYIVHAATGYEYHEERLRKIFEDWHLPFEFVTDGDPSRFSPDLLSRYFTQGIEHHLSPGVLSCTLNHILSYEKMVANGDSYALVFENDPFFIGDFKSKITHIVDEARTLPPGLVASLENTTLEFPAFGRIRSGKYLYKAASGRCAGAYLIDRAAASAILEDLKTTKCHTVIDWWHNRMIDRNVFTMYWAHPPLTEQGSHNGLLHAGISSKSKSWQRRVSWLVQKVYKTYFLRFFRGDRMPKNPF